MTEPDLSVLGSGQRSTHRNSSSAADSDFLSSLGHDFSDDDDHDGAGDGEAELVGAAAESKTASHKARKARNSEEDIKVAFQF